MVLLPEPIVPKLNRNVAMTASTLPEGMRAITGSSFGASRAPGTTTVGYSSERTISMVSASAADLSGR